ncbi:uncharacterized protein LOC133373463 [Rhineura floridana]|uniref:uncharacterized protein LOC133373463 n=1 Tax=Rhineura floridana TaxID=261503 RepID=UPI002AC82651|nr:uncharacterized protein LOC133373463 [Rhineura floridana]
MAWALFFLALLNYCSGVTSQAALTQPASQSVSLGQTAKLSCSKSRVAACLKSHRKPPCLRELTMAWTLFFLALLKYCSGVTSQPAVTQLASQTVSPAQTVKLSCSKSTAGSWDGYFRWYQQKPGQAPRFVLVGTSTRGEGIPDRFTGSASGNAGYLTISNIQAEDEAVYYCCAWESTGGGKFHSDACLDFINPPCLRELTMTWALFFLALLNYCSGVTSQATLTQPPSQSVSLGQTTKLSCSQSSGGSWGSSFYWYQQKPGQAPRFVLYDNSNRGEGIPDRFTGSAYGDTGYLTISNIQDEDEAVYHCSAWEGTGGAKFHSGTI